MSLLIIEDDPAIRNFLKRALTEEGFRVDIAISAEEGLKSLAHSPPNLFIVDLNLPGMDGLDFIQRLRGQGIQEPVLILSARRSVDERVHGLEKGGDDYLTKPFSLAELIARVRVLLRRGTPGQAESGRLTIGDLELDLQRREARRGGDLLNLTVKEFALLAYFCRNSGRVLTRSMIMDKVWGMRFEPSTNVVNVHIYRLRAKIDDNRLKKLIHTIRGAGYVFEPR